MGEPRRPRARPLSGRGHGRFPGRPSEPTVVEAVDATIDAVRAAGNPVGVNTFAEVDADRCIARGASFIFVAADVTLMARGSEAAVARLKQTRSDTDSY